MSGFTYKRGSWEDGMPLPQWEENENGDQYLERIGYTERTAVFGHEDAGNIEIYGSRSTTSFYAHVCPMGGQVFEVFLPDFPSMMMFVRDHATAFAAEASNTTQQQTLDLLEKFFRSEHGHSSHAICPKCDPEAWEERQRRQKQATR